MPLHIRHETIYRYAEPVRYSVQTLKLTPRIEEHQRTLRWELVTPGRRTEQIDAFGNVTHLLTIDAPHDEIRIVVSGSLDVDGPAPLPERGVLSPLVYRASTPFTAPDPMIDALARRHAQVGRAGAAGPAALRDALLELAGSVCDAVRYQPGATTVTDTAATALARGEGVCQDQAHVFVACSRLLAVPARYVSGYLDSGHQHEVASHAWVDVWLGDEAGWFALDVTHRRPVDGHYCRLAVGRDYLDAAPVRGVRRGGGAEELEVRVKVSVTEQ
jgi:transglutaminase-like putative cysteine protease